MEPLQQRGPRALEGSTLTGWGRSREAALHALDRLAELAAGHGDGARADRLRESAGRLAGGRLNLAVLGEFKRGKSTLINRLLGAPVLPVGVVPMTSLPIRVEHGPRPEVEVVLASGERLHLPPPALLEYATEAGNPQNRKAVVRVVARHPAQILASGVVLVDTPGIGSAHDHNTAVAHQALAEADAAVFVLSVDSPASRAELDFLRSVRERIGRIVFVLNKSDLIGPAEREEATQFVLQMLGEAEAGGAVELFSVSAKTADSGFANFRTHLEGLLVGERAGLLLERMRTLGGEALAEERRLLALQRAAMRLSHEQAAERRQRLAARLEEVARARLEVEQLLHADVGRLVTGVVQPAVEEFRETAHQRLATRVAARARSGQLHGRLEQFMADELAPLVLEWLGRLEGEVATGLEAVAARHARRANQLLGEASAEIAEIFEVDLEPVWLAEQLAEASSRVVLLDDQPLALEAAASSLRRLAPGRLGRRLVEREALLRVEEAVDRHCGRLRYDVTTRLTRKEEEWRRELRQALEQLELTVQRAGSLAEDARAQGAEGWARAVRELDQGEQELRLLELQLRA